VTSWYKNARNRLTVTSPWRLLDYWAMTREFDPGEFVFAEASGVERREPTTA
jgi:4-hydroxyacetophenone monooxygenase